MDQRSSYLKSRQIALKKFRPQGGYLAEVFLAETRAAPAGVIPARSHNREELRKVGMTD